MHSKDPKTLLLKEGMQSALLKIYKIRSYMCQSEVAFVDGWPKILATNLLQILIMTRDSLFPKLNLRLILLIAADIFWRDSQYPNFVFKVNLSDLLQIQLTIRFQNDWFCRSWKQGSHHKFTQNFGLKRHESKGNTFNCSSSM